jgi:23S rRNA (pseudouridine1915-N3)-methyltransferase
VNIDIYAVGKLTESYWRQACAEYLKRLGHYAKVTVVEVPDVSEQLFADRGDVLQQEAAGLRNRLKRCQRYIALDVSGELVSSEQLATLLQEQIASGLGSLGFVIGGSCGLEPQLLQDSCHRLSFGRITLPHNLARVVLLEQLYRAFKIIRREPYHK